MCKFQTHGNAVCTSGGFAAYMPRKLPLGLFSGGTAALPSIVFGNQDKKNKLVSLRKRACLFEANFHKDSHSSHTKKCTAKADGYRLFHVPVNDFISCYQPV